MTAATPIMVVEDDEAIREALGDLLSLERYSVLPAKDGKEALDLLESGTRPCWILLDLTMPRMDGEQCLRTIRTHPEWDAIPITLISAGADPGGWAQANNVGFIRKPIDLDLLLEAARKYGSV